MSSLAIAIIRSIDNHISKSKFNIPAMIMSTCISQSLSFIFITIVVVTVSVVLRVVLLLPVLSR